MRQIRLFHVLLALSSCSIVIYCIIFNHNSITSLKVANLTSRLGKRVHHSNGNRPVSISNSTFLPVEMQTVAEMWKYNLPIHIINTLSVQKKSTKVPRLVHFVLLQKMDKLTNSKQDIVMTFLQFLLIRSVYIRVQPDVIMVHCEKEPQGVFWRMALPMVRVVSVKPVYQIFGNPIQQIEHVSDVVRLQILKKYGGVYLDTDMLALKSFEAIFESNKEMVMGVESYAKSSPGKKRRALHVCNAVIFANKDSTFLKRWYNSYISFDDTKWGDHSVLMPATLANKYPKEIALLAPSRFYRPIWKEESLQQLFTTNSVSFKKNVMVHLWGKLATDNYLKNFSAVNPVLSPVVPTSFNRIMRPLLPHPYVSVLIKCQGVHGANLPLIVDTIQSVVDQTIPLFHIVLDQTCNFNENKLVAVKNKIAISSDRVDNWLSFLQNDSIHDRNICWLITLQSGDVLGNRNIFQQFMEKSSSNPHVNRVVIENRIFMYAFLNR